MNLLEALVLVVFGLVLFNSRRLPTLGRGLGRAISNFRRSLNEPGEMDASEKKKDSGEKPPKA